MTAADAHLPPRYPALGQAAAPHDGTGGAPAPVVAQVVQLAEVAGAKRTTPGPPAPVSPLWAGVTGLELLATIEGLTHERLAVLESGGDAVWLRLIDGHLAPRLAELDRRLDRHAAKRAPDPRAGWLTDLAGVARELRRVADIRYPLDLAGWHPTRTSQHGELAGPCPFCGGHDRFVVWPPGSAGGRQRDGRSWCRRCGWAGDAIELYRTLRNVSFARAVEDLAAVSGVALPNPDRSTARTVLANGRAAMEVSV